MAHTSTNRGLAARNQVLNSALKLFTSQGFFNTSIPDIVRASGISTGSIYHHFGDKEGIARALYDSLINRMEDELDDIESASSTAQDRCRAIVSLLYRLAEQEPEMMRYMLNAKHREFMTDVIPVCSSRPFERMRNIVEQGIQQGEIVQVDGIVAAASVFGGPLRMISLHLDGVLEQPLAGTLEDTWKLAWRSVAA